MENAEIKQKNPLNNLALIGLGAFALCVVMLIVGFVSVKNVSFFKIPIVDMVLPDISYDTSEIKEAAQEELEKLEELVDESDLTAKEKDYVEGVIDSTKKFTKKISVSTIKNLAGSVGAIAGTFDSEVAEVNDAIEELQEASRELKKAINVVEKIVLWFMLIPLAFTVLGGLLRSKGWTITAMVVSLPFFFLFGGAVWGIIAIVGYIAQIVIYGKLKKAKRAAAAA